jgi:hypothetical protein
MQRFSGILYSNTILNNGQLSSKKAMPLKDITSDGTSSFSLNRRNYIDSYLSTSLTTSEKLEKKWYGNRDASQVTSNRRVNQIAIGSLNASGETTSFTNVRDPNSERQALHRMRSGGSHVPAKVTNAKVFH